MKYCSRCKTTEGPFIKHNKRRDGSYYHHCVPCNTARVKQYRATEAGKKAVKRAVDKYVANNKERQRAWVQAQRYKKQPCEICGTTENVDRHHDDPVMTLNVLFLCRAHHKQRHQALKSLELVV